MTPREQSLSIICEIAREHGVSSESILGRSRYPKDIKARHAAYAAVKERKGISYPAVGRIFGRDHTTIMSGVRKHGNDGIAGATAGLI